MITRRYKKLFNQFTLELYVLFQVISLLVITLLVLGYFTNMRVRSREETFVKNNIQKYNESIESLVLQKLETTRKVAETTTRVLVSPLIGSIEDQQAQYLSFLMDQNQDIWSLYVGYPDKAFFQISRTSPQDSLVFDEQTRIPDNVRFRYRIISAPLLGETWFYTDSARTVVEKEYIARTRYDPTQRPWFKEAVTNRRLSIIDAYVFGSIAKPVVTVSIPLRRQDSGVPAVIGVDFDITSLSRELRERKISPDSFVCILNAENKIVAQSEILNNSTHSEAQGLIHINQLSSGHLRLAMDTFAQSKENTFFITIQEKKYLVNVLRMFDVENLEWIIVSVTNYEEYVYSQAQIENHNYSLYVFILFIACLQIILLARRIAYPIQDLTAHAEQIGKFDLTDREKITSKISEVGTLARTLQNTRHSLRIFTKYMPSQLVRKLVGTEKEIEIGGERKPLTLLFTDIEGFSTVSEGLSPEDLMKHISVYFEGLSQIIMRHEGLIDKYIGDAIMAFWGAPDDDKTQGKNACRATLACFNALRDYNAQWEKANKPVLKTRFGLHHGEVVVGNIGSSDRMNYTVMGDNVNLAARLEGANKFYRTHILISESLYALVKDEFVCRSVDVIVVKGRTKGVHTYELVGHQADHNLGVPDKNMMAYVTGFNRAFDFYLNLNFKQAIKTVQGLQNLSETQQAIIEEFIERCEVFIKKPPLEGWDGSWTLVSK
ncbi:MAG: adenylate/guanylate cyclase domain-containing protein [Alphaproteobacteria bacterium]|nr:MAG: adenylate/guanylate cyclase domain-containing protein [Alphaproteobacteria bacterium]